MMSGFGFYQNVAGVFICPDVWAESGHKKYSTLAEEKC
jgi:hypothetical protein